MVRPSESRIQHNFVANVITSDVKTVTVLRDHNNNNQLLCVLLLAIYFYRGNTDLFLRLLHKPGIRYLLVNSAYLRKYVDRLFVLSSHKLPITCDIWPLLGDKYLKCMSKWLLLFVSPKFSARCLIKVN